MRGSMNRLFGVVTVVTVSLGLLTACTSGSKATPTAQPKTATKVYNDTRFHFSFHYPANWKTPQQGVEKSIGGLPTYVVTITPPSQMAGLEFRVDAQLSDYSRIPDGKVVVDPSNPQQRFRYHKVVVSQRPSILIERFLVGKPIDEYVTVTNTRKLSYTVEMVTPNPPFPAAATKGYRLILDTEKIAFNG